MKNIYKYKFLIYILFVLFIFTIVISAQKNKKQEKFKLILFEDFQGKKLNERYWSIVDRKNKLWGAKTINNADFINIQKGNLVISSYFVKDKSGNDSLVMGGITSQKKISIKYGKIEVRAKLTDNFGLNSAIWMLADNPKYGNSSREFQLYKHYNGEIDILERVNNENYACNNIHTYNTSKKIDLTPFKKTYTEVKKYHIYSVELYSDKIVFLIDGKINLIYRKKETGFEQFPFDQSYYLMIELQTDSWTGEIKKNFLPARIYVDWIKFYTLK